MNIKLPDEFYDIIIYINLGIILVLIPAMVIKPEMKLQYFLLPAIIGIGYGGVTHAYKDIVEKRYKIDYKGGYLLAGELEEKLMRNDYSATVVSLLAFVIVIFFYLIIIYINYFR